MGQSLLGTRVQRTEDPTLLTGEGRYVADIEIDGLLHAKFVTSTEPHAKIKVDAAAAREVPGVVAVLAAEDFGAAMVPQRFVNDPHMARGPVSREVVRYVGEPVALVVAETLGAAADAAELVEVDYEPLPVSMDGEAVFAAEHGSGAAVGVQLFPERGSDSMKMSFDVEGFVELGAVPAEELSGQEVVVLRLESNRLAVVPMEPHSIAVDPNPNSNPSQNPGGGDAAEAPKITVWVSSQGPHSIRDGLADALGLEHHEVQVISPWVGGGFGGKGGWVPEHIAVTLAARQLGRPIAWLQERTDNLLSMQARHQVQYGRLRLTRDGSFTSLETHAVGEAGAYMEIGALIPMGTRIMAQGVYSFPQVRSDFGAAFTNKSPSTAFRGAGRPQATCMIERLVDLAAAEIGMDPLELRLKNLLQPQDFPVATATGAVYDTGDYAMVLRRVADLADYDSLRRDQAARRAAHSANNTDNDSADNNTKLLGIGLCCYVEITGGPAGPSGDYASVEVTTEGKAIVKAGTFSHGQGHETVFATLVADRLGITDVEFRQSDTLDVPRGDGTGGSRSGQIGGSAVAGACDGVLDDARRIAAQMLEASEDDIVVADNALAVAGVPAASVSWAELATFAEQSAASDSAANSGETELATKLYSEFDFEQANATFPFGAHLSVVEVDPQTGHVEVLRHLAVDDCGIVMNPMIVEGQQHGGAASGISQALWEDVVYDADGIPKTTNLAEYLMPSAAEFPFFEVSSTETPTDLNPLGVKGIGEAGTIGAIPAVHNAVIDALSHLGIRHLDMPLTPEKVWSAIQQAQSQPRIPAAMHSWPSYAAG